MKIDELMTELCAIIKDYGNLDVVIKDTASGNLVRTVSVDIECDEEKKTILLFDVGSES